MAHRNPKDGGGQSGARDLRDTPGKASKPPPMGSKRRIIARHADVKHKAKRG